MIRGERNPSMGPGPGQGTGDNNNGVRMYKNKFCP